MEHSDAPVAQTAAPADQDTLIAAQADAAARLAYLLSGDPVAAEDIASEALARVLWRSRRADIRDVPSYVRAAVVNEARRVGRRDAMRRRLERLASARVPPAGSGTDVVSDRDAVVRLLRRLPPRQREAVVLRHYADLPEAEVARLLQCPVGTAKSLAARGVTGLRRMLDAKGTA